MISNESKASRYWKYLEDWSGSWGRLVEADLIDGDDGGYWLTERGRPLAEQYYAQRPDHYWYYYQHYYPEAQASKAHSELCRRVFGKDLTQDGQVDIDTLHDMMSCLDIKTGDRVLDLGCGAEGNEIMFDSFMLDADSDYLPAAEAGKLRRYLYVVNVSGQEC